MPLAACQRKNIQMLGHNAENVMTDPPVASAFWTPASKPAPAINNRMCN
ncbi:MAG: hypothetical protein ACI83P_002093 [Janthinobacterium sp.]|jgi:hypothetical protein